MRDDILAETKRAGQEESAATTATTTGTTAAKNITSRCC